MTDNSNVTIASKLAGDHAIAFAAKLGDERAFGILFERYQPRILAVALRYTRNPEDAEDIVQQTFQKAFIHLHQFQGKSSFYTWLTRIAVNEALLWLRRGCAQHEVRIDQPSDDEAAMHGLEIPDSDPNPEVKYLKREETEALAAAIRKLRPRLRATIELRELAELSTRETARRMGISVGAARARIFHGRRKLRKTLNTTLVAAKALRPLKVAA